jgi:catechol 2,3-dioxygenase-like lactoylglutathione lyase family enzyme
MTSNAVNVGSFRCKSLAWVRQSFPDQTEESRMSTVDGQISSGGSPSSEPPDLKLETVVIPVADADRSKAFYAGLGRRPDADVSFDNGFRMVPFTPPGSQCSVQFGTHMEPRPDLPMACTRPCPTSKSGATSSSAGEPRSQRFSIPGRQGRNSVERERVIRSAGRIRITSYNSFATFEDPDGNSWLLQEVTDRRDGPTPP